MTLDQARNFVWGFLRAQTRNPTPIVLGLLGVEVDVARQAGAADVPHDVNGVTGGLQGYDSVHVRTAVSELVTTGVLVWGRDGAMQSAPPHLQVTEFGLQCLRDGRPSPYDPEGYLARLPPIDPIARAYLEEALTCLHRSCYRACAVMLGGASETVMIESIEAFRNALQAPRRRATFERDAGDQRPIGQRFACFRTQLATIRPTIPRPLRDELDVRLDGIFALVRQARNEAGHPNIAGTTRETAYANLLLFPSYCQTACALITHLQRHPIP
jgi:hypothetical protein